MTDWQKTLLIKNLNKVKKPYFHDEYLYEKYYDIKNAIRDTFAFSGKANIFKALYDFFIKTHKYNFNIITYIYGYKNADGETVEINKISIKRICKLQKVTNETT